MDKETAIKKAAKFKDDWEIDRLQGLAYNKPTGFMLSLGAVWRDSKGKRQFQVLHWYKEDVPGAQKTSEEVNRLLKEFGILYEAGYMPPLTKEEKEEESRRIHEEAEQARAEFQAQVAKEEEWRRTHPEEYQKEIEQNIRNYFAKMQQDDEKWYHDRGREMPEESKERYAKKTEEMIEKFHREQAARNNIDR